MKSLPPKIEFLKTWSKVKVMIHNTALDDVSVLDNVRLVVHYDCNKIVDGCFEYILHQRFFNYKKFIYGIFLFISPINKVCCPNQFSPVVQNIPQFTPQFTFNTLATGTTAPGITASVPPYQPTVSPTAPTSPACGVSNFTQTRVVGGGPAKLGCEYSQICLKM